MKIQINLLAILILSYCFCSSKIIYAYEFQNFQIKNALEYKELKKSGKLRSSKSFKTFNLQNSPLLEEIEGILTGKYEGIGKAQTDQLLKSYDIGGGIVNFSGFSWHKPMLNYDIYVNRELAPDLMSDQWIVQDSFTIFIEAATLLSNLQKQNLIQISDAKLGAFAGLTFKRTYTYNHFAKSYKEGLTSDFSTLFLGFKQYHVNNLPYLPEYSVLKKEDEYTVNGGGLVKAPLSSSIGLAAGALVKKSFSSIVTLQSVGPEDNDPTGKIRISKESLKSDLTQVQLSLQADFFNLLKISLLEYELDYEFGSSLKSYLKFSAEELSSVLEDEKKSHALTQFLKGQSIPEDLFPYIVASEQRKWENLSSKFSFLLLGEMKKRASEQVHIVKDGINKTFFKSFSESISYVESFFSKLFQSFIFRIFKFKTDTTKRVMTSKTLNIEYEKIKDLKPTQVLKEEQFSFKFSSHIEIRKTHKWYHKNFRNLAIRFVKDFTELPLQIAHHIDSKKIRGPLAITTNIEVEKMALLNFHKNSIDDLISAFMGVCDISKRDYKKYATYKSRRRYLRGKLNTPQKCLKTLITRFESYSNNRYDDRKIDLFKFKKFIGNYLTKANHLEDLYALFGAENIFLHGQITAKTNDGKNFQSFFKSGQFRGLGVIDSFKNNKLTIAIDTTNGTN